MWQVLVAALLGLFLCPVDAMPQAPAQGVIRLEPVVTRGLEQPLFLTHAGDGSGRLFLLEQPGRVRILQHGRLLPAPFLDITSKVRSGGEQGLLGLAFHPMYTKNGRFFMNYTRMPDGATVVAEYKVSTDPLITEKVERVLLAVPQPYANHNGGMLAFGPDGYLYISLGDGGAAGDPGNRAQDRNDLLGKILRIDVDRGTPYAIPPDNPYASGGGRPEIYALGLRNPWRFSFDRKTGNLWAGDVGQDRWEEIDRVVKGGNYGWRIMEGNHCFFPPFFCRTEGLNPPVAEYALTGGRCSIIGGYVYRGRAHPALSGLYLFGDYCSGEIMTLRDGQVTVLLHTELRISSFGEDQDGELYVIDLRGGVYRLHATYARRGADSP